MPRKGLYYIGDFVRHISKRTRIDLHSPVYSGTARWFVCVLQEFQP